MPAPITLIETLDDVRNDACVDVVINLAGESPGNDLWTKKKRIAMRKSRIDVTAGINRQFTKAVAHALNRPTLVSIPAIVVRALGGLCREILLGDQNVVPAKAIASGFIFKDTSVEKTMESLLLSAFR